VRTGALGFAGAAVARSTWVSTAYRASGPTPPSLRCPLCGATGTDDRPCLACCLVLREDCTRGIVSGVICSSLLAALVAPALCLGQPIFALPAIGVWLLGPFLWALPSRRRPGARALERAIGVVMGHAACALAVIMLVAAAAALLSTGLPFE
jgi:hypothetical protein